MLIFVRLWAKYFSPGNKRRSYIHSRLSLKDRSYCLQDAFREQLRLKHLEDRQIEVDAPSSRMPVDVPGMSQV